jgi:hypothetical protein
MLRSIKSLYNFEIGATDGDIGHVTDFYFDDRYWKIRYLIATTGGWLNGRSVLISPSALGEPQWLTKKFPVSLTVNQVENSPDVDTDKPVNRQQVEQMNHYYGWPHDWALDALPAAATTAVAVLPDPTVEISGDPHLRSTKEVTNYNIRAKDGEIGHVYDYVVDDENWVVRYLAIDTGKWLPGKKVLVSPQWLESVSWSDGEVATNLTRDQIQGGPEYDFSAPVNRDYEGRLYDYYGRPVYW